MFSTIFTSLASVYVYKQVLSHKSKLLPVKHTILQVYQNSNFRKEYYPTVLESKDFMNTLKDKGYKFDDLSEDLKDKHTRMEKIISRDSKIKKID